MCALPVVLVYSPYARSYTQRPCDHGQPYSKLAVDDSMLIAAPDCVVGVVAETVGLTPVDAMEESLLAVGEGDDCGDKDDVIWTPTELHSCVVKAVTSILPSPTLASTT